MTNFHERRSAALKLSKGGLYITSKSKDEMLFHIMTRLDITEERVVKVVRRHPEPEERLRTLIRLSSKSSSACATRDHVSSTESSAPPSLPAD